MKHHVVAPLACAILALGASAARASTADASLSGFQIRLFDLDPGDGIAPSVVFQSNQGGTFVAAEAGATNSHGQLDYSTDLASGVTPFGTASASSSKGAAAGFATIVGDAFGSAANVLTFSSSSQAGAYGASTVMLGDGGAYVSFTLSPRTRMVIDGDASASVMSTIDSAYADSWASVALRLADVTGGDQVSNASVQADQGSTHGADPYTSIDARHLEVSFDNLDGASVDGVFFGSVDTQVTDVAPSIPEPAGGVLMLAALGMFAWMQRRRGTRAHRR